MPSSINVDHATGQWHLRLECASDISQGSVAKHLRCSGIFGDGVITNCFLILRMKKFLKVVNI